jgi:hypothetical protein
MSEREKALQLIKQLAGFPSAPALRGKYKKLASGFSGRVLYIARVSVRIRAIFRHDADKITILEIVHHDRLKVFHMALRGIEP